MVNDIILVTKVVGSTSGNNCSRLCITISLSPSCRHVHVWSPTPTSPHISCVFHIGSLSYRLDTHKLVSSYSPSHPCQINHLMTLGVGSLVDKRPYTRRNSGSLAHLPIISLVHPPRLQMRVGRFSPHASSPTTACCFFRGR